MQTNWVIWQLADSAFPSGGFAHSGGLESAMQWHEVDGARLLDFIQSSLIQVGRSSLPFVVAAHNEPEQIGRLDRLCDAFLSNHVANRASRSQGRGFLASADAAFASQEIAELRRLSKHDQLAGHFPPLFGAVTAALRVHVDQTARLFLFLTARSLISSAVRLGIVGPLRGQAIQHHLGPVCERVAQQCGQQCVEDVAQTAPVMDLLQATHDRLYSRLFQS
jgi:urease accessory protein